MRREGVKSDIVRLNSLGLGSKAFWLSYLSRRAIKAFSFIYRLKGIIVLKVNAVTKKKVRTFYST